MWWAVLVAAILIVGVECLRIKMKAVISSHHPKRSWVEFERSNVEEARRIRILSYNVLGPFQGLSSMHGYCPMTLRRWTKRSERLKKEINSYHNAKPGGLHAVCLQEVTPRTLRFTWAPFMKTLGLDRFVYQPKHPHPRRLGLRSDECLGVAIFYSTRYFEKTAEMRVFFPEHVESLRAGNCGIGEGDMLSHGDTSSRVELSTRSRLEEDLTSKLDGAVMVRLRVKGQGGNGGKMDLQPSITLVNCHLWYHPVRPDLKTAQCKLLFDAIRRFHQKYGVAGGSNDVDMSPNGKEGWPYGSSEKGGERGFGRGLAPANLILCGDFNSVPFVNPEFLPGSLKHQAEVTARREARVPPGGFSREGGIYPMYPSTEQTASGVYSLLTYGHVSASHVEHPDAFIPELLRLEQWGDYGTLSQEERIQWMNRQVAPPPHHSTGAWNSGFGSTLEDVYRDRGVSAPRFTTKTSDFRGVIDHIFVSIGEKNSGLGVTGVLGFPEGADMTSANGTKHTEGSNVSCKSEAIPTGAGKPNGDGAKCSLDRPTENTQQGGFGPIPDEIWGSDHLALGVEVVLLQTSNS